jgi:hypothetical protein
MYIDDVLSNNNEQFRSYVDSIYHPTPEHEIKDTTESSTSVAYLDDLFQTDACGKLTTQLYDKQDYFSFSDLIHAHTCIFEIILERNKVI